MKNSQSLTLEKDIIEEQDLFEIERLQNICQEVEEIHNIAYQNLI